MQYLYFYLNVIGHGGAKVQVEHETACGDSWEANDDLLLRTSEALIALKQDKTMVIEISIESVSSIQDVLGSQLTDYVDVTKLELKGKVNGVGNTPVAPVSSAVEAGI